MKITIKTPVGRVTVESQTPLEVRTYSDGIVVAPAVSYELESIPGLDDLTEVVDRKARH